MSAERAGASPIAAPTMRERILQAAAELTAERGWAGVTMGDLAQRVGVSRQTVYNEMGSRPALAEAMVLRELGRFLAEVQAAFDDHPGDAPEALAEAAHRVLVLAAADPLLRAVLAPDPGADPGLLPLLTVRGEAVIDSAIGVVASRLSAVAPDARDADIAVIADIVVRTVLSHVVRPGAAPGDVAESIRWAGARLLS